MTPEGLAPDPVAHWVRFRRTAAAEVTETRVASVEVGPIVQMGVGNRSVQVAQEQSPDRELVALKARAEHSMCSAEVPLLHRRTTEQSRAGSASTYRVGSGRR